MNLLDTYTERMQPQLEAYMASVGPSISQQKQSKLNARTKSKQDKFTQDMLLGMQDAESFITSSLGNTRSTLGPSSFAYDAVELSHGDKQALDAINSNEYKVGQLQQVALLLDKPVDQVTNQDVVDVGNWQQIQKLSDLARTGNEAQWKAPLIRGAVQTNLTGKYSDEFGTAVDAPLNIPIYSQSFNDPSYGRETAQFSNLVGENVTQMAALDPTQNFLTDKAQSYLTGDSGVPVEDEGFFDSLLRAPQAALAGAGKSMYDMADTAVEASGNIVGRGASYFDEDAGKWFDKADLATDEEKTKRVNNMLGYNDAYNSEALASSGKHYDKAMKDVDLFSPSTWANINTSELGDSIADAFSSPEAAGYSFGYLAPALIGVFEKGAIKLLSAAGQTSAKKVAKIATSNASKATKKKRIDSVTRHLSIGDKAKLVLADHIDALGYGAMMTNDQLDEVIKDNDGELPSLWKVGTMVVLNAGGMKLDMASARAIVTGPSFADGLITSMRSMGKNNATKVMGAVMSYGAKLGSAGITEMPQEFIQSYIEAFNKAYGVKQEDGTKLSAVEARRGRTRPYG